MFKLSKSSQLTPTAAAVAEQMRERIGEFKQYVPLIVALRNPGLRARHWEEVSTKCGVAVKPSDDLTLHALVALKLSDHQEALEDISEFATKEHNLEKVLEKMEGEWAGVDLEVNDYRDTGTCILKVVMCKLTLA